MSCLLANDKGDNDMKPGLCTDPGIYCMAKENTGKPRLGDRRMKVVRPSHCLKWGTLSPSDIGKIAQHVREEERRKEEKKMKGKD